MTVLAGCGGDERPSNPDYERWRAQASTECRELVRDAASAELDDVRGTSPEDTLRQLAVKAEPFARRVTETAEATKAIPLPTEGADRARAYVDLLERRAENFAALQAAAEKLDRAETRRRSERDGEISKDLAAASRGAGVDCT